MFHYLAFVTLLALVPTALWFGRGLYDRKKGFGLHGLNNDAWKIGIRWLWVATGCVASVSPFIYEFSGWPVSTPASYHEKTGLIQHPFGMFTVGLNGNHVNIRPKANAVWNLPPVTLLTENPKVRTIYHDWEISITDPVRFAAANKQALFPKHFHTDMDKDRIMKLQIDICQRQLYNFNNAHSKDMAGLFNPKEESQQKEYAALIQSYLGGFFLTNGLSVRARFLVR